MIRNAVQHSENVRNSLVLNYKSAALPRSKFRSDACSLIHVIRVCVLTSVLTYVPAMRVLTMHLIGDKADWRMGGFEPPGSQTHKADFVSDVVPTE
jgi:hypothetical protein